MLSTTSIVPNYAGYKLCIDCFNPIVGKTITRRVIRCNRCNNRERNRKCTERNRKRRTANRVVKVNPECILCHDEVIGRRITSMTRYCVACRKVVNTKWRLITETRHKESIKRRKLESYHRNKFKKQRATRKKIA
jgi:hypothetical protein